MIIISMLYIGPAAYKRYQQCLSHIYYVCEKHIVNLTQFKKQYVKIDAISILFYLNKCLNHLIEKPGEDCYWISLTKMKT